MLEGAKKASRVLEFIECHIISLEEDYSRWMCGITADPEGTRREIGQIGSDWISGDTGTELDARHVEVLLRRGGCHGVPHPGGKEARYVFACLLPASKEPR